MLLIDAVKRRFAVRVRNEEDALVLVSTMKEEFPDKTKNWSIKETKYEVYSENTLYYLNHKRSDSMLFGNFEKRDDTGNDEYRIIDFYEIDEFSVIKQEMLESELPIHFLIG